MNKAAQLAVALGQLDLEDGMGFIQRSTEEAIHFDVIDDTMCIMHSDGSVNIVDQASMGHVTVEVISPENILRVLKHYRPFKEVFNGRLQ